MKINWPEKLGREGHRIFLSDLPIAMHCHHYNINLQDTIEKSLGAEGASLIYRAAEETSYAGFCAFLKHHHQLTTVKSKLELAATSYQYCGLGVILFDDITPDGGRVVAPHSHHVTGWLAKHGRRQTPGCLYTSGWIAGVLSAIFDRHPGEYKVKEVQCKMMREPQCIFQVERV